MQAHAYWRLHGLAVDLVILGEDRDGHQPALHEQITKLIAACGDADRSTSPAASSCAPADKIAEEDRVLLQTVARIVISDGDGSLAQQLERRRATPTSIPRPAERSGVSRESEPPPSQPRGYLRGAT